MKINSGKVIKVLEEIAPEHTAQAWDNVGFMVGSKNRMIDKILVALEVTPEVIAEAVEEGMDLIITHHPLIFSPLKSLTDDDPVGRMVMALVKNNINLLVAHTNLDASPIGLNFYLARALGLERIVNLADGYEKEYFKLAVTVPVSHRELLVETFKEIGAGHYGNYQGCTFTTEGRGTFEPLPGADPALGEIGRPQVVEEVKVEAVIDEGSLPAGIERILKVHPYEMPAYDVIPLQNRFDNPNMGVLGYLDAPLDFEAFLERVKSTLGATNLRVVKGHGRKINKVGILTGAGSDMIPVARARGADVFLTGDIKYHEAQSGRLLGINLIDGGHYETEVFFVKELHRLLSRAFEAQNYDVALFMSRVDINPFEIY
jgi:dinuclear metal center YbgI/SA1388 family protein